MHKYIEKLMLVPEYLPDFQCIGPMCEDHCCKGWGITVDKKSYFALKEIKNKDIANLVANGISRQRGNHSKDREYAKLKLVEDKGNCMMLAADNLCSIHKELGEKYLPHTCSIYPRNTKNLFGIHQQSLTFSCPEAARRALSIKQPMQFIESKVYVREELIEKANTSHAEDMELANEIRFFCINLLQFREISLWKRLAILGYFCEQADILRSQHKGLEVVNLISSITNSLSGNDWEELFGVVSPDFEKQIITSFYLMVLQVESNAEYYQKIVGLVLDGLNTEPEKIVARYQAVLELGASKFIEQHEYILENFLVNDVFTCGFPLLTGKVWFEAWLWFVGLYKILIYSWVGLFANFGEKMNEETAITATQALVKSFTHTQEDFKRYVISYLREEGMPDFASSLSLLKPE